MNENLVIVLIYFICKINFLSSNSISRISNGFIYAQKRFIPSENYFYLGSYPSQNRLHCIRLCQESSLCQTMMFNRNKQECTLFSEHVEYGLGRLVDENHQNLVTIRLDKDSLKDLHRIVKKSKDEDKSSPALFSFHRRKTNKQTVCENCEL